MAKKYYSVKVGRHPGIYTSWEECSREVLNYPNAKYKGFSTIEEAKNYLKDGEVQKYLTQEEAQELESFIEKQEVGNNLHIDGPVAYVDGSFDVATNNYSCGVVILHNEEEILINNKDNLEDLLPMRNVAGEILGAIIAMQYACENNFDKLTIVHDYQGIASWCNNEWKATKKATKAYQSFYNDIKDKVDIHFVKVKGHSGDFFNDIADSLAKLALGMKVSTSKLDYINEHMNKEESESDING